MASDNEQQNVQRMITATEDMDARITAVDKRVDEVRGMVLNLNTQVQQLKEQMVKTALIGRDNGATAG